MNIKLLKYIIVTSISFLFLFSYLISIGVEKDLSIKAENLSISEIDTITSMFSVNLENNKKSVLQLSYDINLIGDDSILKSIYSVSKVNPEYLSVYFSDFNGRVISSLVGGEVVNFNGSKSAWFLGAISKPEEIYVSMPYQDVLTSTYTITLSKAISYDDGRLGVVAIDLTASNLMNGVSRNREYIFYFDNGIIWLDSNKNRIGDNINDLDESFNSLAIEELHMYSKGDDWSSIYKSNFLYGNLMVFTDQNYNVNSKDFMLISSISAFILVIIVFSVIVIVLVRMEIKNIPLIVSWLNKISEGNLIKLKINKSNNELDLIVYSVSQLLVRLSGVIESSIDISNSVNQSSEELTFVMGNSTKNIQNELAQIEEISTAISELSSTSKEVSFNASQAEDEAIKAINNVQYGNEALNKSIALTKIINESIKETAAMIEELKNSAIDISEVTHVISSISGQTNLLALNAAIEAARAGEQGTWLCRRC